MDLVERMKSGDSTYSASFDRLVQVGGQSMADRYTYLPLAGVFVMCVWGAADLLAGSKHRTLVVAVAAAAVLACCIGAARFQLGFWHDSETLFTRDLKLFPANNPMAHHCLGRAYGSRKHRQ